MPKKQPISESTRIQVKIGKTTFGGNAFAVIAGPCSIESEDQFLQTATAVKGSGASVLRGGIWKMRTSPNSFQGLGTTALSYIQSVKQQTGMALISEVVDPRHIESVFEMVDAFQVGARNMHNYELLRELGKQSKPVMLKRNFSAYIDEWFKASDYITQGGNDQILLCERGIRTFETATRNTLDLNAVAYAKKYSPFPVIVDPSHAIGISDLVPQICYASAAAGADGLIVEVHPTPDEALSDADQALDFTQFDKMMKQLERVLHAFDKTLQR
jgi:3-deoxy-7-phosphoheptulonate synthase